MTSQFSKIDDSMLAECSLNRATSYVTTNGMIQVTLCGLFATTIAVLVALAEQSGSTSSPAIYNFVIPAFSFVIMTVSLNVFGWISEQLTYLDWFGRAGGKMNKFLSFEEFLEQIRDEWYKKSHFCKIRFLAWNSIRFYFLMPFRFNNIYCYYFFLYAITPIVGILYGGGTAAAWPAIPTIILIQLIIIGSGLKGYIVLEFVRDAVRAKLTEIQTDPIEPQKSIDNPNEESTCED